MLCSTNPFFLWSDRLYSLLASQGRRQNFPAPRARRLGHPASPHLPDRDCPPLNNSHPAAVALPPALAVWHLALLDWSCCYRRRPSLRCLGAGTSAEPSSSVTIKAGPRVDYHRPYASSVIPSHWYSDRVSWHRDCAFPGARGHRFRPNLPRVVGQAQQRGGVDAFPVRRDVCHLCSSDRCPVPYLL